MASLCVEENLRTIRYIIKNLHLCKYLFLWNEYRNKIHAEAGIRKKKKRSVPKKLRDNSAGPVTGSATVPAPKTNRHCKSFPGSVVPFSYQC
jgi:hypothetical protein